MKVFSTGGVKEAWLELKGKVTGGKNAVDKEAADFRDCEHNL